MNPRVIRPWHGDKVDLTVTPDEVAGLPEELLEQLSKRRKPSKVRSRPIVETHVESSKPNEFDRARKRYETYAAAQKRHQLMREALRK